MYVGLTRVEDIFVVVPQDASVQHPSPKGIQEVDLQPYTLNRFTFALLLGLQFADFLGFRI